MVYGVCMKYCITDQSQVKLIYKLIYYATLNYICLRGIPSFKH